MKKIFRYSFALVAGVALLVGCNTSNEGAIYSGEKGVAFNAPIWIVSPSTDDTSFELPLNRANADAALTVEISGGDSFTDDMAEIFTIPASASFAAGEYTTMITIGMDASLMELGVSYNFTVRSSHPSVNANPELPKGNDESAWDAPKYRGYAETEVRCTIPLIWEAWANVVWTTDVDIFTNPIPATEMVLEKAQGMEIFRFPDVYEDGYEFRFSWNITDKETSIMPSGDAIVYQNVPVIRQSTGLAYDDTSSIYWLTDYDPEYTFYDPATQTFTINSAYYVYVDKDYSTVGGFGWFNDYFEITEFLQGNPW